MLCILIYPQLYDVFIPFLVTTVFPLYFILPVKDIWHILDSLEKENCHPYSFTLKGKGTENTSSSFTPASLHNVKTQGYPFFFYASGFYVSVRKEIYLL